ncbi:MAG: MotA/TolQ/ExbB proton channel family protein [Candidatus Manganitrophaceae bacterium]
MNTGSSSLFELVLAAGIVGKSVLATLLVASIITWAIILYKWLSLRKTEAENRRFLVVFSKTEDLLEIQQKSLKRNEGPMVILYQTTIDKARPYLDGAGGAPLPSINGNRSVLLTGLERTLHSGVQDEMAHQERYLHLLATIGNTSPFVGLLGTVWGIITAFQEIGRQGNANIASVAPGIAEALVTTAAGLLVAIPAVVAYNIFANKIQKMEVQLEVFSSELTSLVEEKLFQLHGGRKVT